MQHISLIFYWLSEVLINLVVHWSTLHKCKHYHFNWSQIDVYHKWIDVYHKWIDVYHKGIAESKQNT
jgi:hypothetical protein